MTDLEQPATELSPTVAWSRRVRRVGGFIQLAFAALWLVRGALNLHGTVKIAGGRRLRRHWCSRFWPMASGSPPGPVPVHRAQRRSGSSDQ